MTSRPGLKSSAAGNIAAITPLRGSLVQVYSLAISESESNSVISFGPSFVCFWEMSVEL